MTDQSVRELSRRAPSSGRRTWLVIAVILAAIGFLAYKGLGDATTYFRNVDEALAQRESLGTKRFRLQGTVVPSSLEDDGAGVRFNVEFKCKVIEVRHTRDTPPLFDEAIPVVVVGAFMPNSNVFASDEIVIKHTEAYQTEKAKRIADAERESCPTRASG